MAHTTTKPLAVCPGCGGRCLSLDSATPTVNHLRGCRYIDCIYRHDLENAVGWPRVSSGGGVATQPVSPLRRLSSDLAEVRQGDRSKPELADSPPICRRCGSLIGDSKKHAEWHRELVQAHQRNRRSFRIENIP